MTDTSNDIKILDCTIRDGGLINNWDFSTEFVQKLYQSLSEAGVEYMEVGYKNSRNLVQSEGVGPWRFLDEEFLRNVFPEKTNTKLSALVDIGRVEDKDLLPCSESQLDLLRVACYLKDIDKAIELVEKFNKLGYETSVNIMAVSNAMEHDLTDALDKLNASSVDTAYIVDSYGTLFNRDFEHLINLFKKHLPNKQLGIHAHNNLQMAFSNTLFASQNGVNFLDSSVYGMGRAAGNCPTELLVGQLKNPKYEIRPILRVLEELFIPLREKIEWGYIIPYAITGQLNEHPRTAMALRNSENKDKFLGFYDKLTSVEIPK